MGPSAAAKLLIITQETYSRLGKAGLFQDRALRPLTHPQNIKQIFFFKCFVFILAYQDYISFSTKKVN